MYRYGEVASYGIMFSSWVKTRREGRINEDLDAKTKQQIPIQTRHNTVASTSVARYNVLVQYGPNCTRTVGGGVAALCLCLCLCLCL
jgi:hypothetical protein